jgi:hypothetical protein
MSALLNSSLRWGVVGVLMTLSVSAWATIVMDGRVGHSRSGVVGGVVVHSMPVSTVTSYSLARSRAWMNYQRGDAMTSRNLVGVPLAGAWMSSSASQTNARTHVARAQAYRQGRGE